MRSINPSAGSVDPSTSPTPIGAIDLVLQQARRLHRDACTGSLVAAMPVLRRLRAAGVTGDMSLAGLFRARVGLQRKQLLRLLAVEAGYPSWEAWRPALSLLPVDALEHFRVRDDWFVFLNHWFSDPKQAEAHAATHGGRVYCVGSQAVVVPPDADTAPRWRRRHDA